MKSIFLKVFFVLTPIILLSQTPFEANVIGALQKPQPFFEKVFVHTNKEVYSKTDVIWFKVYVVSNGNTPSFRTTLVYVDLFDSKGELIETKNVLINKGVGTGQFFLNDSLSGNKVYLQAYTNHMKNFGDDHVYSQSIDFFERTVKKETKPVATYDIQFLPEGGHFLEGVQNRMGIKVLVNGQGSNFEGFVIDSNGERVAGFFEEIFGMGTCSFIYSENESYKAILKINDTTIQKPLPKAKKTGLALSVLNSEEKNITIRLQTNKKSNKTHGDNYNILLHQRNHLIDYLPIVLTDTSKIVIDVYKEFFYNGVNTITIFKDDQPILRRNFFVEKEDKKRASVFLNRFEKGQDSVSYELVLGNFHPSAAKSIRSNLSVSVVSIDDNYAYQHRASISSAFLLTPYINGYVESPFYYFDESKEKRLEHLDVLLLNQGWVQYSNKSQELYPGLKHSFELGFNLKGQVSPVVSDSLVLLSSKDEIIDKIALKGKTDFDFNRLLVYKGDSVKIAFLKNRVEAIKPKNMVIDTFLHSPASLKQTIFNKQEIEINNATSFFEGYYGDNITRLDEVEVSTKRLSKRRLERNRLMKKYSPIVFDIGKYYNLEIADWYRSEKYGILDFLQRQEGATLTNWNGVEWYLKLGSNKEAVLYIDGKRVVSGRLGTLSLNMNDVENVLVQSIRGNRIYQAFTTENYKNGIEELYLGYVIKNGYNHSMKYYTPLYDMNNSFSFPTKEIDWKTDLYADKHGKISFKIANTYYKNLTFIVKGVSDEGHIIEEIIEMD